MRSLAHQLLARYLRTDQYAFETTSRELWPQPTVQPQETRSHASSRQAGDNGVYGELEPQN